MTHTLHFVSLLFYDHQRDANVIRTEIVQDVDDQQTALGIAIYRHNLSASFSLVDHVVVRHSYLIDVPKPLIDPNTAISGFLKLIRTRGYTIREDIISIVSKPNNRLLAIKELREHLKPYLGLKACKEIVDLWMDELNITPLFTLVISYMQKSNMVDKNGNPNVY